LRKNINEKTAVGLAAQSYMQAGKLVPDDVVLKILQNEVAHLSADKSVLLDGFPRTTHQAAKLREFFNVDTVVSLDIPHQTIVDRLSQRWIHQPSSRTYSYDYNPPKVNGIDDVTGEALTQREDDKPHVVQKRLEEYAAMTAPLLAYYKSLQEMQRSGTPGIKAPVVAEFQGTESDVIYKSVKPFFLNDMKLAPV
jgi:adenylate kinase